MCRRTGAASCYILPNIASRIGGKRTCNCLLVCAALLGGKNAPNVSHNGKQCANTDNQRACNDHQCLNKVFPSRTAQHCAGY